ncbi:MAG: bicyclomycin resistance protein [Rhodocyclaceae bacterium]|nr:bicyclomycin resistance protein [Rhodocyclaceae bacterium]MCA3020586.1 bicyclomycin resistance protein [Rhodocyclaceae bacterium]MCA3053722.1 bicyclomycin resistance protein [Rhodocyclaceae bacterium]
MASGAHVLAASSNPASASASAAASTYVPDKTKVLRYAFEVAESSMDPQKVSDVYSTIVNNAIFDTPLRYDYLARPLKAVPNTLVAMPEVTDNHKTFTMRVKPGIYFADHPVFGGKKRELTAEDYVFTIKRLFDPKLSAPLLAEVEGYVVGSDELLKRVRKANKMDYDTPLEGLRALDRYTFQIKLTETKPDFFYVLTDCRVSCAVAREIVEHYGTDIGSNPVGTGAYQLTSWKRSSRMVFEYNPNFREAYFEGEPSPDDKAGQEILAQMKGKRLPQVYRVEVAIIEERQPRYLSFINNEFDLIWLFPEDFANMSFPNRTLAPNLKKMGIQMQQVAALDLTYIYFNMEDKTVGGYKPENVALRRAISLGYKTEDEINIIRKGQAIPAHTPYAPGVQGWTPDFRTSANEYDPAKAKALLDLYGYKDVDGDGYREMPDGSPLVLRNNSTPTDRDKQFDELWKRSMDAIGIRIEVTKGKWPDFLKASDAGKLMMWQLGGSASTPTAETWLQSLYGPNSGFKGNRARFQLEAYDDLFAKSELLPDGPERTKLYQEMARLVVAYAPWKINTHRILTDLYYPYLVGFRRPAVQTQSWWRFVDIDVPLMKQYEAKR